MSEEVIVNFTHSHESISPISAGTMIRNAREAEGLHIDALAVLLKVPVKKLEALEADRFDLLPDIVFVRALAASVCRTLKIESTLVLEKLPNSTANSLKFDESGINTPFRESSDSLGMSFVQQIFKPLFWAVLALLVGVAVIVFLPMTQKVGLSSAPKLDMALEVSAQQKTSSEPVNSIKSESFPTPNLDTSVINNSVTATTSSLPIGVQNVQAVTVIGSEATNGIIVFKATGVSWVEVIDANKVVQIRKTLANGEIVGASGVTPLSVVVGKADTTEVKVRGKSFDLTPIAKDNVARFEVK